MELLKELFQVSIGKIPKLSRIPTESEWHELFEIAQKHSLITFLLLVLEIDRHSANTTSSRF